MIFHHEFREFPEIESYENENGRFYKTEIGDLPSVTTFLGAMNPDKEKGLQEWRDRIGEREATRILNQAGVRGKLMHTLIEKYVMMEAIDTKPLMPSTLQSFNQFKTELDKHLTAVHAIEFPMYSKRIRIAGRGDMWGRWDNTRSMIDFKTSLREKRVEHITDYFLQLTCYAMMLEEITMKPCDQIVILMASDDTPEAQVFVESSYKYRKQVRRLADEYHSTHRISR